jgi:hypothetical protein
MDIFLRPPSSSWELVTLPDVPGAAAWAWIRPPAAPCGIVLQVAIEVHSAHPEVFTVRRLLGALGVDCKQTRMCITGLDVFDSMQGMNPLLDRPLESAFAGAAPTVTVHLAPPTAFAAPRPVMTSPVAVPAAMSYCSQAVPVCDPKAETVYRTIEADWHVIQVLESKNLTLRKQLNTMLTKFMSLNRDLSPDERNHSDSQDHRDWQEARRWLRDGVAVMSRMVRVHDVGVTSTAGQRNKFDDLMNQYVIPRRPHPQLSEIQHQFEVHRKTVQSLNTELLSSMHGHAHEGEIKAQLVISRIRLKVQAARGKR